MGSTTTADIARMLGSIHDRDHYTVLRDFFELSAISIRNAVDFGRDRETYEMRYKAIAEKYRKEYLDIIARAFAMLGARMPKARRRQTCRGCPKTCPKSRKTGNYAYFRAIFSENLQKSTKKARKIAKNPAFEKVSKK